MFLRSGIGDWCLIFLTVAMSLAVDPLVDVAVLPLMLIFCIEFWMPFVDFGSGGVVSRFPLFPLLADNPLLRISDELDDVKLLLLELLTTLPLLEGLYGGGGFLEDEGGGC